MRDPRPPVVRRLTLSGGWLLQAQLRVSAVNGEGDFCGLSGSRSELGLRYEWSWQSWRFGALARAEFNDSEDEVFASRWMEIGGGAVGDVAAVDLRRRALPCVRRDIRRRTVAEAWETPHARSGWKRPGSCWQQAQLFVRYEHERNASPIAAYDYDRNWVAASIEYWR